MSLEGTLTFPGIAGPWTYNARLKAAYAFTGDSQTGQIWLSGAGSSPPTGSAGSGGYLSIAIAPEWDINDNTGTHIHTVMVRDTLNVAAGGTYGFTPTVSADGKHGGGSLSYNFTESWHEELLGGKPVTLLFRKGPAE